MRVAMLLHKDVSHDARVRREAAALLEAGHEVTVVHLPACRAGSAATYPRQVGKIRSENEEPETEEAYALIAATLGRGRRRLPHPVRLGVEAARLGWKATNARPEAVHAHDAAMLLPGLLAARSSGARLVYDSHELATGVPYRDRSWATVVDVVERLGAPRADAVITVSDGIAARLKDRYRLRNAPEVVRNLPDLPPPGAKPAPNLRRELGVGEAPLVLHQGAVAAGRGCETLLEALAMIPQAHLLLLGAEGPYAERLRALADTRGMGTRVHLLPPVPLEALLSHTAQADVGVSLLENSCENHRLALPNKLFEYVAAGVPVVVSDLPEAASLVREREIGWCADPGDPHSVAIALRAALAHMDDENLAQRLGRAAVELNWEREKERLLALYEELEDDRRVQGQ